MQTIKNLLAWAVGKRTYGLVLAGVAVWVAHHYGYVTTGHEQSAFELLGFGTVASLRAALANLLQGVQAQAKAPVQQ